MPKRRRGPDIGPIRKRRNQKEQKTWKREEKELNKYTQAKELLLKPV
jgi:hypothetical protein